MVEILVAIGIFGLLAGSIIEVYIKSNQVNRTLSDQLSGEGEVRTLTQHFVNEVRAAQYSSLGAYPVSMATDNEVDFYTNLDSDPLVEKVRYFLVGSVIKKGVTKPTTTPLAYLPGDEVITDVLHNVTTTAPIFTYYVNGSSDFALGQPVALGHVRLVGINIRIDKNPASGPVPFSIQTKTQIRSLEGLAISTASTPIIFSQCESINSYGGADDDEGRAIVVSPDGNYSYITGYTKSQSYGDGDVFVAKLRTLDQSIVWKRHYGGSAYEEGNEVVVSADGDYVYVTGAELSENVGNTGKYDVFVMKLSSSDGTIVWAKHYGGNGEDDRGVGLLLLGGYVYINGSEDSVTAGANGYNDVFLLKLNDTNDSSGGSVEWSKRWGTTSHDSSEPIVANGNSIYLAGRTFGRQLIMKLNENGTPVWSKYYTGGITSDAFANDITVANDYVYSTGYESSNPLGLVNTQCEDDNCNKMQMLVSKVSETDGAVTWAKRYGGMQILSNGKYDGMAMMEGIKVSGNDIFIGGGEGTDATPATPSSYLLYDFLFAKLNSDGTVAWMNHYGGNEWEYNWHNPIDLYGGFIYSAGMVLSPPTAGGRDIFVAKIDQNQTSSNMDPVKWSINAQDIGWSATNVNWTVSGTSLGWAAQSFTAWNSADITDWSSEGTTLDDELIYGWKTLKCN